MDLSFCQGAHTQNIRKHDKFIANWNPYGFLIVELSNFIFHIKTWKSICKTYNLLCKITKQPRICLGWFYHIFSFKRIPLLIGKLSLLNKCQNIYVSILMAIFPSYAHVSKKFKNLLHNIVSEKSKEKITKLRLSLSSTKHKEKCIKETT